MRYHMLPMRRNRAHAVTPRQPNWLLVYAMLALSVHALANLGLMPGRAQFTSDGQGNVFAEICTGQGMVKIGTNALRSALPAGPQHETDCCELCAIGGGPAVAAHDMVQMPTLLAAGTKWGPGLPSASRQADWLLQAPRGPPLLT